MSNYKETTATGTQWTRCRLVTVLNPLNEPPIINFIEENIINIGSSYIVQDAGAITKKYNATSTFPILDPSTGVATDRVMTHNELYSIIYSLYMQTALERDAQQGV